MHEKPKMELREFFAALKYERLASFFESGLLGAEDVAHRERTQTMLEAMDLIPVIREAVMGAQAAEDNGDSKSAEVLRQHAQLMTAFVRIAEDMGYEW